MIRYDNHVDESWGGRQPRLRVLQHIKINSAEELQRNFYTYGTLLGRGTFGTVVQGQSIENGKKWAIKIINKAQKSEARVKMLERELTILRVVSHPHIIHLERVFESPSTLFLVLEFCKCELKDIFEKRRRFTEDETRVVMQRLTSAVDYLHRNDIVHRDIKMENIMLAENPEDPRDNLYIKLADFGLSVMKGGAGRDFMLLERCGTLLYMAPELLLNQVYNEQCDVWSMGVLMYLMLSGEFPFVRVSLDNVKNLQPDLKRPSLASVSWPAIRLLQGMLCKDPSQRISTKEAVGTRHKQARSSEVRGSFCQFGVFSPLRTEYCSAPPPQMTSAQYRRIYGYALPPQTTIAPAIPETWPGSTPLNMSPSASTEDMLKWLSPPTQVNNTYESIPNATFGVPDPNRNLREVGSIRGTQLSRKHTYS